MTALGHEDQFLLPGCLFSRCRASARRERVAVDLGRFDQQVQQRPRLLVGMVELHHSNRRLVHLHPALLHHLGNLVRKGNFVAIPQQIRGPLDDGFGA